MSKRDRERVRERKRERERERERAGINFEAVSDMTEIPCGAWLKDFQYTYRV